jgi:hypothetical protein
VTQPVARGQPWAAETVRLSRREATTVKRTNTGTRAKIEASFRNAGYHRVNATCGLPSSEVWEDADGRRMAMLAHGYGPGAACEWWEIEKAPEP